MKKHTIWSSLINVEDWANDLREDYPDLSTAELYDLAHEINDEYFLDEQENLKQDLEDTVIIIADLGLWLGRRSGYRLLNTRNLGDCLTVPGSIDGQVEWYIDERKDLCCRASHHDGVNYYTSRVWKPDASDACRKHLIEKVYYGTATRKDITRCTRRLGDRVARVYGWTG